MLRVLYSNSYFLCIKPHDAIVRERGYERGDAVPSIDIAKRMADAFEVSLDYLVGASEKQLNKEMVKRIEDVDKMKPDDKKMIYAFLDAFITKAKLQTLL